MALSGKKSNGEKSKLLSNLKPFLTIFFAEMLGTMVLLFVGCASVADFLGDPVVPHHIKGIGFGLAVHLAIQMFGHISACHINPAVSIVSLLLGLINIFQFAVYVVAQFLGATAGFGFLKLLFPEDYVKPGFCMTTVSSQISITQAFFIEIFITCILCLVLCSVWDPRNSSNTDSTPVRFALIISILSIIGGPLTGASMNTARSFGPALFGSDWSDQWIYWIAPNLSPFISVGIYKLVFSETKVDSNKRQNLQDEAFA